MAFANLKIRVITALCLAALVIAALIFSQLSPWGRFFLFGLGYLVVLLSAAEFAVFSSAWSQGTKVSRFVYIGTSFFLCILPSTAALHLINQGALSFALDIPNLWSLRIFLGYCGITAFLAVCYLCAIGRNDIGLVQKVSALLLPALLHIGLGGGSLCFITLCQSPEAAILWLVLLCTANDTAAYFVGSRLGGPKLAPAISPNKTWSGSIGGLSAATVFGTLSAIVFNLVDSWQQAILLSILCAIAGQAGDLLKSILKRQCGVKDSGNLLPGHGGVYDRTDAILACAALLVFFV